MERAMRWTAVAIALVALIDPPLTLSWHSRPRVSVAVSGSADRSRAVQRAVEEVLASDFEIVDGLDRSADGIVFVGDRYPDDVIDGRALVSTVTVPDPPPPVAIDRIVAARAVPPASSIAIGIDLVSSGSKESSTPLTIRADGLELARRPHAESGAAGRWHEDVRVPTVGEAPLLLELGAGETRIPIAIDAAPRLRIFVIESRPSWASAFVRRALEDDPRFQVSGSLLPSPSKLVATGEASALGTDLTAFDAVVIGGLDRLAPATLTTVERFARERGGSVILLPDGSVPASLVERLVPGTVFHETLLDAPAVLDTKTTVRLQASELLEASNLPVGAAVLAMAPSVKAPIVWSVPSGDGHILVSGALDAWRYRGADDRGFDRFWRSVITGAALSAQSAIDVTVVPAHAAVGDRVRVVARVRSLEARELGNRIAISASVDDQPIRLWPDARSGTFVGEFVVDRRTATRTRRVTATIAGSGSGSRLLAIGASARPIAAPPLSQLSAARSGVDVDPSSLDRLLRHLRRAIPPQPMGAVQHPMRSAWWFIPFAACLCGEWWLRRRRGER